MNIEEDLLNMESDIGENGPEEELRLILIGKTGSGKSASGNTILGQSHFLSKFSAGSVTKVCQQGTSDYPVEEEAGRRSRRKKVVVVDLPGFGDTHLSKEQIITEISRCVALTAPGPHAFLLVVPLGRYTEEENTAATMMAAVFGEAALHTHTVVLFTRGDDLEEPMEEYLASAPASLKALIDRCGGRYHVLNNRAPSDVQQVHELLGKVEQVVEDNHGGCYTNEMYLKVEAAVREEQDRLRREEQDRLRREEQDRIRRERAPAEGGLNSRPPSSSTGWRSEVFSSHSLMEKVRNIVAAGLAGLVVGAVCGALIPLAAGLGAFCMGSTLAIGAAQIGMGAAVGGFLGGGTGLVTGLDTDSPFEGALKTLHQVGSKGVIVVGGAAVLGALGAAGAKGVVGAVEAVGAVEDVGAAGTVGAAGAAGTVGAVAVVTTVVGILAKVKLKGNIKTGEFELN